MELFWKVGRASVREIQEMLPETRRPAYTTVQTIVRRLQEKGAVQPVRKIGNAYVFEPLITRQSTHRRLVAELLELFGGSARPLMAHLIEEKKLTIEDLREMENTLKALEQDATAGAIHREAAVRPPRKER
jgi:predicted transcriptional regulator